MCGVGDYCRKIGEELRSLSFWRDVLAEFVATFFLVSVQCALPLVWDGQRNKGDVIQTALGMGFVVMTMAGSLGDFGGGHLNPAVTVGLAVIMEVTITRAVLYIVAQCLGGIAGAMLVKVVTPSDVRGGLAATTLNPNLKWWQGLTIEAWITMLLVFTILGATNVRRKKTLYMPTILIGFAVACGIMCAFSSTGASMNPARSLGPAVAMSIWTDHWVYWAGPCIGGILAAVLFTMMDRPGRPEKEIL